MNNVSFTDRSANPGTAPCGDSGWQAGLSEGFISISEQYEYVAAELGESPIERMFIVAGLLLNLIDKPWFDFGLQGPQFDGSPYHSYVFTQEKIENYRVDFLVMGTGIFDEVNIVVECDGHEFHERNATQAARDRQRDRRLQLLGYHILRFTGSELYNCSFACACEVARLLIEKSSVSGKPAVALFAPSLDRHIAGAAARRSNRTAAANSGEAD